MRPESFAPKGLRPHRLRSLPPNTAHPECERSERIEGAVGLARSGPDRPLDTLAALALGVSGSGEDALEPLGKGVRCEPRPAVRATAAVAAAVGLAVGSIVALRPFDARITGWAAGWVIPDSLAWAVIDHGLRLGLVALVVAAAAATRAPWRALGRALLLISGGNLFAELLKTAIERARPSDVPLGGGNSLPSGHVLGCTVTALVALGLLRRVGWSGRTRTALAALAVAAVLAEGAIRVGRGSHWPSDIPASVLLGVAWVVGAEAAGAAGPRTAAAWGLTLAAGYLFFLLNPAWRLPVP